MPVELKMFLVDAFTKLPFRGNPAAVTFLESNETITDDMKLRLSAEMNQGETVFVIKLDPKDSFEKSSKFGIRWFTRKTEVDLCGHATLAAAKTLIECFGNPSPKLSFETNRSGTVYCSPKEDGSVVLDFPNHDPHKVVPNHFEDLVKVAACGVKVNEVLFSPPTKKLLVRLDDSLARSEFEKLDPPTDVLYKMFPGRAVICGVILTVKGSKENGCDDRSGDAYDFISRFFAPWDGVSEDHVCGSAHSVLAPYWGKVLGKSTLKAWQCSKRGGELSLKVREDDRVEIGGHAVVVLKGSIII